MYTDYYKLKSLPFQLTPDPRFFFGSSGHNGAMAYLTYGLSQSEGFIIITGDVGAGKTTLVSYLLSTLDPETYVWARVVTTQLQADDMLRMVASSFALPTDGADKATLLGRVQAFLEQNHVAGKRVLLVVDEAQNLPVPALEELRMLSNFQVGERTPLQCLLLGQPQFRAVLGARDLDQLRQRVIASYHLGPLNAAETRAYVEHRLKLADWKNDPEISDEAFQRIYDYTGGVPRMINVICSRLLLFGFREEVHSLDADAVERVAVEHERELAQVVDEQGPPVDGAASAGAQLPAGWTPAAPPPAAPPPAHAGFDGEQEDLLRRLRALEERGNRDEVLRRLGGLEEMWTQLRLQLGQLLRLAEARYEQENENGRGGEARGWDGGQRGYRPRGARRRGPGYYRQRHER
jgi:putative secretion ATPase (PEP-CTERM system associated)